MTYKVIIRVDTDESSVERIRDHICDLLAEEGVSDFEIAVESLRDNKFVKISSHV